MRTIEINLYEFEELSQEAQQKAIKNLYDINVDHDWWEDTYYDAEQIGLKITGFDIGRGNYCAGHFIKDALEVAQDILNNHGEDCETYKTAQNFLNKHAPIFSEYMNEDSEHYESSESERELINIEDEFLNSLLEDYKITLRNEYEWRTEKKQIIETIKCDEYEFNDKGEIA